MTGACVIGVGNPYRGDDGAGLAVARAVADLAPEGVRICELDGDVARLLDLWTDDDEVYVADMVRCGDPAGSVHWWDVRAHDVVAESLRGSSHHVSLAEVFALGRVLGRLPRTLVLVGVEGADYDAGCELSPAVSRGVDDAAHRILAAVGQAVRAAPHPPKLQRLRAR
ncbi:MAG: hydrogenase maturation protease [Nocardioidaceae bacterium]